MCVYVVCFCVSAYACSVRNSTGLEVPVTLGSDNYPFCSLIMISNLRASGFLNSCVVFANEDSFAQSICEKGFSLSEAVWERDSLGSEDLKSFGSPLPPEQKHPVQIRTGKLLLTKRNALTTEPKMQI
jgi:hypothetical protein